MTRVEITCVEPKEVEVKRLSIIAIPLVGLACLAASAANAQSVMAGDEMFIEMLKHDIREARTDVMTSVMKLSAEDAAVFWPIYNDYRQKANALADKELAHINEYAGAYWSLTNSQAAEMASNFFKTEGERAALLEELYNNLAEALTPVQALKAAQLEYRLDLVLDMQIVNELPMVE
jgi:hypothetical protein